MSDMGETSEQVVRRTFMTVFGQIQPPLPPLAMVRVLREVIAIMSVNDRLEFAKELCPAGWIVLPVSDTELPFLEIQDYWSSQEISYLVAQALIRARLAPADGLKWAMGEGPKIVGLGKVARREVLHALRGAQRS